MIDWLVLNAMSAVFQIFIGRKGRGYVGKARLVNQSQYKKMGGLDYFIPTPLHPPLVTYNEVSSTVGRGTGQDSAVWNLGQDL